MIYPIILEKLYENMDEATVGQWLISPGDKIHKDDIIVQLIADKMSAEIAAPADSVLAEILIPEKSVVPFGIVLGILTDEPAAGFDSSKWKKSNQELLAKQQQQNSLNLNLLDEQPGVVNQAKEVAPAAQPSIDNPGIKTAPAARIFARKAGVNLQAVAAFTGREVIHRKDVEDFLAAQNQRKTSTPAISLPSNRKVESVISPTASRRIALLTGASGGIGLATAVKLATVGCDLALQYHSHPELLQPIQEQCQAVGASVTLFQADLLQPGASARLVQQVIETFARIEILVSAAGILADAPVAFMTDEQWQKVLLLNLTVPFELTRAAALPMSRQKWGRIIYLASDAGRMGSANRANYAAAKEGLLGLARSVAREMAGLGVTANAICPGFIDTQMTAVIPERRRQELFKGIPLRRFGTPEEVAELIAFLASNSSAYITGQQFSVDGGLFMG
ncbi:MAG: 3-oxoacyl-ACP reductase FabG [Lentisphaeria bacterium]